MPGWIRYHVRRGPNPEIRRLERQRASWARMKEQVEAKYRREA